MGLKRGDIAILSAPGDYGKPRPALVLQDDTFHELHSIVVALVSTDLQDGPAQVRLRVLPKPENGLRRESEVMVDKLVTTPRSKVSDPIGRLSIGEMGKITTMLALLLGMQTGSVEVPPSR